RMDTGLGICDYFGRRWELCKSRSVYAEQRIFAPYGYDPWFGRESIYAGIWTKVEFQEYGRTTQQDRLCGGQSKSDRKNNGRPDSWGATFYRTVFGERIGRL